MFRRWFVLLVACGGSSKSSVRPGEVEEIGIELQRQVATQTWYRAPTVCGQGPYEIEVPVSGNKYGEEVVVTLSTPRRVALTAVVLGDDREVAKRAGLFDRDGIGHGPAENQRCVADERERRATIRGGGGGGGGTVVPDVPVGTTIVTPPPSPPVSLIVEDAPPEASFEVVRFGWREYDRVSRVRVRLWSVEPNDLEFVRFGVVHLEWRPNIDEAEYEAYLRRQQLRAEARREPPAASHARWQRQVADDERRVAKARKRAEAEQDRKRRREAYCAAHPESRDCWGAGGKRRWAELDELAQRATQYCATQPEDVRCWSGAERARREAAWRKRVAEVSPKQPDGPPPAPREETPPPRLSDNAEWRPGYWLWTGFTWIWLGGMWRVPDEDIVAERTTTAPVPPPPPHIEEIPPPPTATIVWVSGFWQWNGTQYVWIPGGYQARPQAGMTWRPAEWRARGAVHVLVPGGWIRVGGRR